MTSAALTSPANLKREKRKRLLTPSGILNLTKEVIKKFHEETVTEDYNDSICDPIKKSREISCTDDHNYSLPFKKIKISDQSRNENLDVPLLITQRLSKLTQREQEYECIFTNSPLYVDVLPEENYVKRFYNPKKRRRHKTRIESPTLENMLAIGRSPKTDHTPPPKMMNLFNRFENCALFIRPSRLQSITDIGSIVHSFRDFGRVSDIQNHYMRPNGSWSQCSSVWMGATVTYTRTEDLHRAMKAFSLGNSPLICVYLHEHLSRIHSVESKYLYLSYRHKCLSSSGTSISVENFHVQSSRSKLKAEFECYGTLLGIKWMRFRDDMCSCLVTYSSTTSAVAAALALHGKKVEKFTLKTRIKMTKKEIFIHRRLCEMF